MAAYKARVLCISDYYLPGYKGGGPIRTIENMADQLDDIQFWVFTRDRDLGSKEPYNGVPHNEWANFGKARVYYASPSNFSLIGILRALKDNSFDVLYLNSFFSAKATILPLLVFKLGVLSNIPVVLAPRGEFSSGAIKLKARKKQAFIQLAKIFRLYRNICWQASSEHEATDIRREMGGDCRVIIAADLLSMPEAHVASPPQDLMHKRNDGVLHIAFVSRISPIKNLAYLIDLLEEVNSSVVLNIYGPSEDENYWAECMGKIVSLPKCITVKYHGGIDAHAVKAAFSENDLFVFPTLGENFGHVIFESLRAGTPVIVSDQTPWQPGLDNEVTVLSLADRKAWIKKIEEFANLSEAEHSLTRKKAFNYALNYYTHNQALEANKTLFIHE